MKYTSERGWWEVFVQRWRFLRHRAVEDPIQSLLNPVRRALWISPPSGSDNKNILHQNNKARLCLTDYIREMPRSELPLFGLGHTDSWVVKETTEHSPWAERCRCLALAGHPQPTLPGPPTGSQPW